MLTITTVLSLFSLLIISSITYLLSKKFKKPYTVLLVFVGMTIVGLSQISWLSPYIGFLKEITLTPELLFYVFLPILIFESAFNMSTRRLVENAWSISLLSIVSLLISALVVSLGLYLTLPLFGLNVPYVITLLFGAIISATDPVAVLALFKEFGAPKRLTMIFEGESLFNDGTAVALFLVVLSVAENGFHGAGTIIEGILMFVEMVVLGIILGIIIATIFSRGLKHIKNNEFITITMLIVSAHMAFIVSELINEHAMFGLQIHISSIIATTVSSLFLGNYSRHSLPPRIDEYLDKSIEHLAFVANSLVFLLAGILFASSRFDITQMAWPIVVVVLIVATARIISVYLVTKPLNKLKLEADIPKSWQALLSWGSLRGSLAIIVVLLIPEHIVFNGLGREYQARELLLSLTIGCILATLFIKALTIGPLIKKLKINQPTPLKLAHNNMFRQYYILTEIDRLEKNHERGFIKKKSYDKSLSELRLDLKTLEQERQELVRQHGTKLLEQSLRQVSIDIENNYLKELYANEEIDESVYRRIRGKLNLQREKIEHGKFEEIDESLYIDRKDIFDKLVLYIQSSIFHKTQSGSPIQMYGYYRAQSILSRKVVSIISQMQNQYSQPIFDKNAYRTIQDLYKKYKKGSDEKVKQITKNHRADLNEFMGELSAKSLRASGNASLELLMSKGVIDTATSAEIENR